MPAAMKTKELKEKYLEFFRKKQHAIISSSSLIPEHDPTVLFTTAGMHPLVPYLMGHPHPQGKRLANCQKCMRTGDIDKVGDSLHLTFFEMLGNWSLGDYFKKEAIEWSFEFLTKVLCFSCDTLSVTVFGGDKDVPDVPSDEDSLRIWRSIGIPQERIYLLPGEDNWWGPVGKTGPCGPCTEMFIDSGKEKCSKDCRPGCGCGKYFEVWNDVFMEYNQTGEGKYEKLKQKNVDTGMGVERMAAMLQGKKTIYEIETFLPIIEKIKDIARIKSEGKPEGSGLHRTSIETSPEPSPEMSIRIIADHIRAATFILGDDLGIAPSNLDQGYILRRFIRRSIQHGKRLGIEKEFLSELAEIVISLHKEDYKELEKNKDFIRDELKKEDEKFRRTLEKGLRRFAAMSENKEISGKEAFLLFQSYGFPLEMSEELAGEKKVKIDSKGFYEEFQRHQQLSREGAKKRFKGGMGDHSVETTKLHTATHLLNQALREVLGRRDIFQRGSNITQERLRFDFNFERKLTKEELAKTEEWVNKRIREGLPVKMEEMRREDAGKIGAQGVFGDKYGEKVFVYSIGDKSIEICGGPHVKNTKELGHFKIKKEESSAAGVRRIKAVLDG